MANFRMAEEDLLDFHAVAELRGVTASSLLHQHIRQFVREEKKNDLEEFEKAKEKVREKRKRAKERWNKVKPPHFIKVPVVEANQMDKKPEKPKTVKKLKSGR